MRWLLGRFTRPCTNGVSQILSILNISNWQFPVKVPEGAWRLDCHLDHYHGDRYVETLAGSFVGGDEDTPFPAEFEIAVMLQFPPEFTGQFEALRHSRLGYLMVSPIGFEQRQVVGRVRFKNPFFGKGASSIGGIGSKSLEAMLVANESSLARDATSGAEPPARSKEESREFDRESQELQKRMKENRQIALMEAEDGTNLRLTFDFFPRKGP